MSVSSDVVFVCVRATRVCVRVCPTQAHRQHPQHTNNKNQARYLLVAEAGRRRRKAGEELGAIQQGLVEVRGQVGAGEAAVPVLDDVAAVPIFLFFFGWGEG